MQQFVGLRKHKTHSRMTFLLLIILRYVFVIEWWKFYPVTVQSMFMYSTFNSMSQFNEQTRKEENGTRNKKTHFTSPQKSNIIYEKYRICLKRFVVLLIDGKWWLSAKCSLHSMFSLIVSKTIACVNKMRVNRCDRICKTKDVAEQNSCMPSIII